MMDLILRIARRAAVPVVGAIAAAIGAFFVNDLGVAFDPEAVENLRLALEALVLALLAWAGKRVNDERKAARDEQEETADGG